MCLSTQRNADIIHWSSEQTCFCCFTRCRGAECSITLRTIELLVTLIESVEAKQHFCTSRVTELSCTVYYNTGEYQCENS